jgi:hypothetical protein
MTVQMGLLPVASLRYISSESIIHCSSSLPHFLQWIELQLFQHFQLDKITKKLGNILVCKIDISINTLILKLEAVCSAETWAPIYKLLRIISQNTEILIDVLRFVGSLALSFS